MATEIKQKGIIYCSKEQFDTLMSTGSVVIGGNTFNYEDGWQYAVIDKDYVDLTSNQGIQGTKVFGRGNDDTAVVKIGPKPGSSQTLISVEGQGPQAGYSVALNPDGIEFTQGGGTTQYLTMPTTSGTIVVGIFRHSIKISNSTGDFIGITAFTSSSAEINTPAKFASYIEAIGTGEPIYCDGVFVGSTAPTPCAVELVNHSGTVSVRYGTNGQGLSTFSISSYSDFVVQL